MEGVHSAICTKPGLLCEIFGNLCISDTVRDVGIQAGVVFFYFRIRSIDFLQQPHFFSCDLTNGILSAGGCCFQKRSGNVPVADTRKQVRTPTPAIPPKL